jgi:predicted nucleic acid-binding protein
MKPVPVDTNVLVRLATGDSVVEHAAAHALLKAEGIRILPTVLLETEWVLRSLYAYSPAQFSAFIEWLLAAERVAFAEPEQTRAAVRLHRDGFDFADAMHVVAAAGAPLATFDRTLARRAARHGLAMHALPLRPQGA